uniref:Aminopeptidase N-like N-terminal domain-containing protein n=1 Tax=Cynoglossus semilaevis TaxID=244447 RepID=A0A3P8VFT7_CYNSE
MTPKSYERFVHIELTNHSQITHCELITYCELISRITLCKLIFHCELIFRCELIFHYEQMTLRPDKDPPIATNGQPWDCMRLPKTVSPVHYDLRIHPNLTSLNFSGSVYIKDKQISNVRLLAPEGIRPLRMLEYPGFHQLTLLSDSPLTKGQKYVVQLDFAANLSDSFRGFYKGSYRTSSGEVWVLASTQFEATFTRGAFPCFDEPAFKANFTVRIIREPQHITISNMPKIKTVKLSGGLLEDYFDTTVKMSTYLLAYIVCDFLSASRTTNRGVKISAYALPEKINQTAFALYAAVKLLDFYEDYFDIPYPLLKQGL